ncbi:MAG: hypothetical protein WC101_00495 [Candidatus Gracilibacteria bacterium]
MKLSRLSIGIGLALVLITGTVFALKGNLLKGSFDAFDASKDIKITNILSSRNFHVADGNPFTVSYTLDKGAKNLFASISGPDESKKFQKIFALNAADMGAGDHTIAISPVDAKKLFQASGQYRVTIIAYNKDDEISDYKSAVTNIFLDATKVAEAPKTGTPQWGTVLDTIKNMPKVQTITNTAPNKPEIVSPKGTVTVTDSPLSQTILLQWNDKGDTTPGPEKDASGNIVRNYKWAIVKANLTPTASESRVNTAMQNSLIYGVEWHDEAKFKDANMGDVQKCVKETMDATGTAYQFANGTHAKSYVCSLAAIPTSVVKTMVSGKYAAVVFAGDGELSSFSVQPFTLDVKTTEGKPVPVIVKDDPIPANNNLGIEITFANKVQDEDSGDMYAQLKVARPFTSKIKDGDVKIILESKYFATKSYNLAVKGNDIIFANNTFPTDSVVVNGVTLKAGDKNTPDPNNTGLSFKSSMPNYVALPPVKIGLVDAKWQSSDINWTLKYTADNTDTIQQQKGVISAVIEKPKLAVVPDSVAAWYTWGDNGTSNNMDFDVKNSGGMIPKNVLKKMQEKNITLYNVIFDVPNQSSSWIGMTVGGSSACSYKDGIPFGWQNGKLSKNTYGFSTYSYVCQTANNAYVQAIKEYKAIPKSGTFHVKFQGPQKFATPYPDFGPLGAIDWESLLK